MHDLIFSDGQKISHDELFPKAILYNANPKQLVVRKQPKGSLTISNPSTFDVELLEQNGVIVQQKSEPRKEARNEEPMIGIGPNVITIELDGDVPVRSQCTACGAIFDAGSEHTVEANYAALHSQWMRHCKAAHAKDVNI